jgi:hypothetical protein
MAGAILELNGLSVNSRPAGDLKEAVTRDGAPVGLPWDD